MASKISLLVHEPPYDNRDEHRRRCEAPPRSECERRCDIKEDRRRIHRVSHLRVEAEHQTRESKDQPIQPTLPVSQRPSGQEDDDCEKELKLRQPDKRAFGEIVHGGFGHSTAMSMWMANRAGRSAEILARIVRLF